MKNENSQEKKQSDLYTPLAAVLPDNTGCVGISTDTQHRGDVSVLKLNHL